MRLKLLPALLIACLPTAPAQTWVREDKTDSFTDQKLVQYVLVGKFLDAPQNAAPMAPKMVLRCKVGAHNYGRDTLDGKLIDARIDVGTILRGNGADIPGSYRLDDGKIQNTRFTSSTDFQGAFIRELVVYNFFYGHQLPHRERTDPPVKKVVVKLDEHLAAGVVMQFDMPDPSEVEKDCGITFHPKR